MSPNDDPSYTEVEAQEILRRASALQTSRAMTRGELIRAAAEVGISPQAIEEAEAQVARERREAELLQQFRKERRKALVSSLWGLVVYVGLAALIAGRNLHYWWFAGFLALCGVWGALKEIWLTFNERSDAWQSAYQKYRDGKMRRTELPSGSADDVLREILSRHSPDQKLSVIKEYREQTGLDLKDAKDDVDRYYRQHPDEVRLHTS